MKKVVLLLFALTLMVLLASCELVDMFHYCESACPVCDKCRDLKCTINICTEKCEGNHSEHIHSLNLVDATDPTCEVEGNEAYFVCECGMMFADEAGVDYRLKTVARVYANLPKTTR